MADKEPSADLPVAADPDMGSGDAAFAEAGVADQAPAKVKKGGKGALFLAFLALLIALAVAAEAGWRWYLKYQGTDTGSQLASTSEELAGLESSLAAQQRQLADTRSALEQADRRQASALAEARELYAERINALANAAPPSPRDWRLAEVEYLLRIANHRVRMERDIAAAITLLLGADELLRELDEFGFFPVRERIAGEVAALRSARGLDTAGIYLRLGALASQVDKLPRNLPAYSPAEQDAAPEASTADKLLGRVTSLVQFRNHEQSALRPLLAPKEAWYLEQNLRLMLEQAQLGLLRRDQTVYLQSVRQAAQWVADYYDPEAPVTQVLASELGALAKVQVNQDPPDISGSLTRLQELRAATPAAAGAR